MARGNKVPDQVAAMIKTAQRQALVSIDEVRQAAKPRDTVDDAALAFFPMTDPGSAERYAKRFEGRLAHVPAHGWLAWSGSRWAREGAEEAAMLAAHHTARALPDDAAAVRASGEDREIEKRKEGGPLMLSDKLESWRRASESSQKLSAIVKHADVFLRVSADKLDTDPFKINVLNGTLIVRRNGDGDDPIVFRPHDPGELITKLVLVEYRPEADSPRYDAFLADIQPNPATVRFQDQWGGYRLTGSTAEQKLAFFYGKGRNGKSTLVDAWATIAGDFGAVVPIETFLDQGRGRNAGAATPDLAALPGMRFLRTSEPDKGAKLAEALIKLCTGGEAMKARHLNRDYFEFCAAFKLTMSGNYRPSISGTDEGIWRRIILVPFAVTLQKPDPGLLGALRAEASGILNRLLDGRRDWLEHERFASCLGATTRRHNVARSQLLAWRRAILAEEAAPRFVPVVLMPDAGGAAAATPLEAPRSRIEVVLRCGRRLIVESAVDAETVLKLARGARGAQVIPVLVGARVWLSAANPRDAV